MQLVKCPICEGIMEKGPNLKTSDLMDKQIIETQLYFCVRCLLTRGKIVGSSKTTVTVKK